MLRILIPLILLGGAAVAFFLESPDRTIEGLREAMQAGDTAELEDRVDFPALRESLKAEFNAYIVTGAAEELPENPLGAIAMGIASTLIDRVVEAAVTPSGLARLASGDPHPPTDPARGPPRERASGPFADAVIELETLSRFSAWVPTDMTDEDIRFVFRRRGLDWVLTAVELPELR